MTRHHQNSIDVTLEERDDLPMGLIGVVFNIDYTFTPGRPGSMYARNGDPGDPPEPEEIEYGEMEALFVSPEGEASRGARPNEDAALVKWMEDQINGDGGMREYLDGLVHEDLERSAEAQDAAREDALEARREREHTKQGDQQ